MIRVEEKRPMNWQRGLLMTKRLVVIVGIILCVMSGFVIYPLSVNAAGDNERIIGKTYDLGEKDAYDIALAQDASEEADRFWVEGDISDISTKNGFVSYAVNSGNLTIMLDKEYGKELFTPDKEEDWHIITDKSKVVDSTELGQDIGSGAIIVQTSKDGKAWINVDTETDFYNKMDFINNRTINGEILESFYETTNVQITSGCYYRIIVAYKLKRTVEPSKVLFVKMENTEEKERLEIYEFYAYNPNVNQEEELNNNAFEFSTVYRVDSQEGFENPTLIKSDDPHNDWTLGKFYISGFTSDRLDEDVPVFLKTPGDKVSLWFNLEQKLDKCNGNTDIRVEDTLSGSDIYFGTPEIKDFGKGTLIVRKTGKNNKQERQIYTNYLEASATVGANTRVDLFEEGDYEVALDYQLHYNKPFVFGVSTTKIYTYRVFFKFKVRNGDVSLFIRDIDTNQFLSNANIAENGFYIDVAQSKYLEISIKREVLSESMDGLTEDTKFTGVAQEGRHYTDEGIYTVTVNNPATGGSVEKKVYVGNQDILKSHMVTGASISEINERLAMGAYIDENGYIIDPIPEVIEETTEEVEETMADKVTELEQDVNEPVAIVLEDEKEEVVAESVIEEQIEKQERNYVIPTGIIIVVGLGMALLTGRKRKVTKEADKE